MSKIKFILCLSLFLIINFKSYTDENTYIVYKINNEIITNTDIEKEYRYLVSLNNQLKDLEKQKVIELSKESALREKIKKIELAKYFDFKTLNIKIDNYLENFYRNLDIANKRYSTEEESKKAYDSVEIDQQRLTQSRRGTKCMRVKKK